MRAREVAQLLRALLVSSRGIGSHDPHGSSEETVGNSSFRHLNVHSCFRGYQAYVGHIIIRSGKITIDTQNNLIFFFYVEAQGRRDGSAIKKCPVLTEDLISGSCTHMTKNNHLFFQCQGIKGHHLISAVTFMHMVKIYMCMNSQTHKTKNKLIRF